MKKVIVVGGGLAGLISSIVLKQNGFVVQLIERKKYPFHRVCGEYVSNEVVPFLQSLNIPIDFKKLPTFSKFLLTSISGNEAGLELDLGGFGISRYKLDEILYEKALELGVEVQHQVVEHICFEEETFTVSIRGQQDQSADFVIGSFGKRSILDKSLDRQFIKNRSPYIGVKYHIKYDLHPEDTVALHNFEGGYCGINSIEDGRTNLCYLAKRDNLKLHGDITTMEREVLCKNPHLNNIWNKADFLFDKPEVINEISFETKEPIYNHILMCGDAAGMITPLCGNGMAMAISSSKLLCDLMIKHTQRKNFSRQALEREYHDQWNSFFRNRLWAGRKLQNLFGASLVSTMSVSLARYFKPVANYLVSKTHGQPF